MGPGLFYHITYVLRIFMSFSFFLVTAVGSKIAGHSLTLAKPDLTLIGPKTHKRRQKTSDVVKSTRST